MGVMNCISTITRLGKYGVSEKSKEVQFPKVSVNAIDTLLIDILFVITLLIGIFFVGAFFVGTFSLTFSKLALS